MEGDACDACGRDDYRNPAVAVDAVALREGAFGIEALLIRRGGDPEIWQGRWAFPGGFVDYGEDPELAVLRELGEEAGVNGYNPIVLAIHGDPSRDPRKHIIALFYLVDVDSRAEPQGGDDAVDAAWVPIAGLTANEVAGSHIRIIEQIRK
ncbi:MAG: NUDIX hydrolase [Candidatus Thalassarchaeaceae archaeon]|jgi:8-oxo-dGTP diphosphatase|nr:NUDIX hydrolase [Candidatus Thalassarchaeaceae archaeon]MDP7445875.1 NUDIX hydrolase [Candidatus Thalassarchaeaceae archaeon]MDP7648849.1 NUDIX hydrolase [Candidatus Thalassarchaeaceae archaeon]HJL54321.1 NUDIX hydrolase [Candidatus Thalassarchaeaceae archaeon]HJM77091.1 NUDIX hydrolase [Candidatus Thalassarchaeaceae archaeon]|tara:strand:+ start:3129 stop:3581 length:453 start_codon:yes stop_codon:yes gene_type:complete